MTAAEVALADALAPARRIVDEQVGVVQASLDAVRVSLDVREAADRDARLHEVSVLKERLREGDIALMKALEVLEGALSREVNVTVLPAEVTVPVSVSPPEVKISVTE